MDREKVREREKAKIWREKEHWKRERTERERSEKGRKHKRSERKKIQTLKWRGKLKHGLLNRCKSKN